MTHDQTEQLTVVLNASDYADLIQLLDQRIKSERGRAAAYKARRDHSNQMIANGRKLQLLELRNALVTGCRQEVDDV